jgi:hypothetical protein
VGVSIVGTGVALVDSSTGEGDLFGDGEGSGVGDFCGDADFFGDGGGDGRFFAFVDLLAVFFPVPVFECEGVGDALLVFFFFEGVGVALWSDVAFFLFAAGVSLGFGVVLPLFFCREAFGFGDGDSFAEGDDRGFGVG